MNRFIKLNPESELFYSMLKAGKHREFFLLSVIAMRARRTPDAVYKLAVGEALIGDWASYGMTRQNYRTALANLKEWGLVTIRTTRKGTIAKLSNTEVYDINAVEANHQSNQEPTISQPSANHQLTTNKNDKKVKNEKNVKKKETPLPEDFQLTDAMRSWFKDQNFTIDIDQATDRWKDAMMAKGRTYTNWSAAWRNGMKLAQGWYDQRRETIQPVQAAPAKRKPFPGVQDDLPATGTGGDA